MLSNREPQCILIEAHNKNEANFKIQRVCGQNVASKYKF